MFFIFSITLLCRAMAWKCGTTPENTPEVIHIGSKMRQLQGQSESRESSVDSIRLFFHFTPDFTLGDSAVENSLNEDIIPAVQEFFAARLKVNRIIGPLALEGLTDICSGEVQVPASHQDPGVPDTDIIIYMRSVNDTSSTFIARAGPCVSESGERTNILAGQIIINSAIYNQNTFSSNFPVMIHETIHLLGFVSGVYTSYMKPDGSTYTIDELTEEITIRGVNKRVYKGPSVLSRAREVYGCSELIGLELEELDADSQLLSSHWDARIVFNEIMAPFLTQIPIYSEFTFGLLEDSGWYTIDWDYPEAPQFGRDKGCEFGNSLCIIGEEPAFEPEFCNEAAATSITCNFYHTAAGFCDRYTYTSSVPEEFQYFSNPNEGGYSFNDYCPVRRSFADRNCLDPQSNVLDYFGETTCVNCKCMTGTLIQNGISLTNSDDNFHSSCFELISGCDTNTPVFRVGNEEIGYFELTCTTGAIVSAPDDSGFNGYLNCPNTEIVCGRHNCLNSCYGRGKCNDGICECQTGRGGDDCSIVCDSSCLNCSGTGANECTTGCTGQNRVLTDGTCVCPAGYIESGDDCILSNVECQGLCVTCSSIDGTQCDTCVDNSSRTNTEEDFSSCECDSGFTISATGTSCQANATCEGLCDTCNPLDGTQCETCVDDSSRTNTEEDFSSCECDSGFTISATGTSCQANATCEGLCDTCNPLDGTQCDTCVDNSSRTSTEEDFSSCECDSGFTISSTGTSCQANAICEGLCNTCNPLDGTQCETCVDDSSRTNTEEDFSSCECDSGFTISAAGTFCQANATCEDLCETCNPLDGTQCETCIDNSSRTNAEEDFSSCECDSGFTISSTGNSCQANATCKGLCDTCNPLDGTQCETCVDNSSRTNTEEDFSSCECDSGFTVSSIGTSCQANATCEGLCGTCNPLDGTQCDTCVDNSSRTNTEVDFSSCECDSGFTISTTGTSCQANATCEGLCDTCNPLDGTQCETCIENSSRTNTEEDFSSCECDSGFTISTTGNSCQANATCEGLCDTCNPLNGTQCETCVDNSSRTNTEEDFSSCECDSGFTISATGTSCQANATCEGLCDTCNPLDGTQCETCVDNSSRTITEEDFSSCECDSGFTISTTGTSCQANAICEGLCDACNPLDGTQCETCADNSSRTNTEEDFSSCECDSGFTISSTGTSCISDLACDGLCNTCSSLDRTQCDTCVENSSRTNTEELFSSCECDTGYTISSTGTSCQLIATCEGLCNTCNPLDGTQCDTCVDDSSRTNTEEDFSSCECDSGFTISTTGTSCQANATCEGLCDTCNPLNGSQCETCVDNSSRTNTEQDFSSCECDSGFTISATGTSCQANATCEGLCDTCNPLDGTQCETCVDDSSRTNAEEDFSSCECDSGFTISSTGTSCQANATCEGLCDTCNPLNGSQCETCVDNSSRTNTEEDFSSCECDSGFTVSTTGNSCQANATCEGLCDTCNPLDGTQCDTCVEDSSRTNTEEDFSSCECDSGFTISTTGNSCQANATCEGLCDTCNPLDGTQCETCVEDSSRTNTEEDFSSCECDSGFTISATGTSCQANAICEDLCDTCNPLDGTQCENCVDNSSRTNTEEDFSSCECDSGFTISSTGTSCQASAACEDLCDTCSSLDGTQCFTCIDNSSRTNTEEPFSSCECNSGYTLSSTGISCQLIATCEGLCDTCNPLDGAQCDTCVDNSSRTNTEEEYSSCQCDSGYSSIGSECIEVSLDTFIFDTLSLEYQSEIFSTFVTSEESAPAVSPLNGLFFDDDFLGLQFIESPSPLLDYRNFGFSVWVRLQEEGGTLLQVLEASRLRRLSEEVKLEFGVTESMNLSLKGEYLSSHEMISEEETLPLNTWTLVGFSISYDEGNDISTIILYIDGAEVLSALVAGSLDVTDAPGIYVGGSPFGGGMIGFILSFSISTGSIPASLFDNSSFCVNPPECNLPGGSCSYDQVLVNDICTTCNCGGSACLRLTDCRLNDDILCDVFSSFYECEQCFPQSQLVDGECQCDPNSTYNTLTNQCICNIGYISEGLICTQCDHFFYPSQITALVSEKYTEINVLFDNNVLYLSTDCSYLISSLSLADLGNSPICTWVSPRHLQIQFGKMFNTDLATLSLNPEAFIQDGCDFSPLAELTIPINVIGEVPLPKAHIDGPKIVSSKCIESDLILSGEGSTGLIQHPLIYSWSVVSTPASQGLANFIADVKSSTLRIPSIWLTEGVHFFKLTVTNIFGQSDSTSHTLNVVNVPVLTVTLDPGYDITITSEDKLIVRASVINGCHKRSWTFYRWNYEGAKEDRVYINWGKIISNSQGQENTLFFMPGDLPAGYTYVFKVSVYTNGVEGSELLHVTVKKPNLRAVINKLSGEISNQEDLVLIGNASYDPYSQKTSLSHKWSCDGYCPVSAVGHSSVLVVPKSDLQVGNTYFIVLTVTDGERQDATHVELTVVDLSPQQLPTPKAYFNWVNGEDLILKADTNKMASDIIVWYQVLGDSIYPSTSDKLPYIKFSGKQFKEGQFYSVQASYSDKHGKEVKELFTWKVISGVDCLSNLLVNHSGGNKYILSLENCESKDWYNKPFTFVFGVILDDQEIPLGRESSKNYLYIKMPKGTYKMFGKICDSDYKCNMKTAIVENYGRFLREEINFNFIEDIADPENIPASIYFYSTEFTLSGQEWTLMFETLQKYMMNQPDYSNDFVSACVVALNSLLKQRVVSSSKATLALETLESVVVDHQISLSNVSIQILCHALDTIIPKFIDNVGFTVTTQRVMHNIISKYMKDTPPLDLPVVFYSENVHIYRERVLGNMLPGNSFTFGSYKISLPVDISFDSSEVIDVCAIVIESDKSVIDVSLVKTGEYSDLVYTYFEEEEDRTASLGSPIFMDVPIATGKRDLECLSLSSDKWVSEGCSVVDIKSSTCYLELNTDELISVRSSHEESYSLFSIYLTGGLLVFMGIYTFVRAGGKEESTVVNSTIYDMKNMSLGASVDRPNLRRAYCESNPTEQCDKDHVNVNSVPNTEANKTKLQLFCEGHLLIGQFKSYYLSAVQRSLLLFASIFTCMTLSGVLCICLNTPEYLSEFAIYIFLAALGSTIVTGTLDLIMNKFSLVGRYLTMGLIISICVVGNVILVLTGKPGDYWVLIFSTGTIVDLFFFQSLYTLFKCIFKKNH